MPDAGSGTAAPIRSLVIAESISRPGVAYILATGMCIAHPAPDYLDQYE